MKKFIRITVLHPNNVEGDTDHYFRPDEIIGMQKATSMDTRQRSDIKSIVHLKSGTAYATDMTVGEIFEQLDELTVS